MNLSAVAPSFEASGEVTSVGEIGISESVLECELDLGIRGGVRSPLASGGSGGVRWWMGLRASTFKAKFVVVEKKLVGLESR